MPRHAGRRPQRNRRRCVLVRENHVAVGDRVEVVEPCQTPQLRASTKMLVSQAGLYAWGMSPKKTPRKAARAHRRGAAQTGTVTLQSPKAVMPSLFRLVRDITAAADRAVVTAGARKPDDEREARLVLFDLTQLERGCNALKSVSQLCGEGYWEFATGIARQLFELVLNVERVATFEDREVAIQRYGLFAALQRLEHGRNLLRYAAACGDPIDHTDLREIETELEHERFAEFHLKAKDGKLRRYEDGSLKILDSWSGDNARQLAKASKKPQRLAQYDLMFTAWSRESHATPGATLRDPLAVGTNSENVAAKEYAQTLQTTMMAILLFIDLWKLLPHMPKPPDPDQFTLWRVATQKQAIKHAPGPAYGFRSSPAGIVDF